MAICKWDIICLMISTSLTTQNTELTSLISADTF